MRRFGIVVVAALVASGCAADLDADPLAAGPDDHRRRPAGSHDLDVGRDDHDEHGRHDDDAPRRRSRRRPCRRCPSRPRHRRRTARSSHDRGRLDRDPPDRADADDVRGHPPVDPRQRPGALAGVGDARRDRQRRRRRAPRQPQPRLPRPRRAAARRRGHHVDRARAGTSTACGPRRSSRPTPCGSSTRPRCRLPPCSPAIHRARSASGSSSISTWRHDRHCVPRPRRPLVAAHSLALARSHRRKGAPLTATTRRARWAALLLALGAGFLVALSLPPWGWWPLAVVGVVLFEVALGPQPGRRAGFGRGMAFGLGWLAMGMGWMWQLTVPGYLAASLIFACLHGLAELAAPNGRWRVIGRPAAHSLVEALRFSFPFGGVPLASLGIAQVAGPLGGIARVGGVILITWVVFQLGFALGAMAEAGRSRRPDWPAVAAVAAVAVVVVASLLAPRGTGTGRSLDVAAVQGGGDQGTRALDVPTAVVTGRHLEATRSIEPDPALDVVLWPENVVDTERLRVERGAGGDRRRGGPARCPVRRRRHRGRPRASRPDHQRPGRRHPRRRRHEPLRQGAAGPVRRVRPAARVSGGDRGAGRPGADERRRRHHPGRHRAARRHAARCGHLVGGVLRRAGPRGRQGRRRGAPQPDQRCQLHRHHRADPAGGLEPAAGDRDRPLGRASGADRVLGVRRRRPAT